MVPLERIAEVWTPLRAVLRRPDGAPLVAVADQVREPSPDTTWCDAGGEADEPFPPDEMDRLHRVLLSIRSPLSVLVTLRERALEPVGRRWADDPDDLLGIVSDLHHTQQGDHPVAQRHLLQPELLPVRRLDQ